MVLIVARRAEVSITITFEAMESQLQWKARHFMPLVMVVEKSRLLSSNAEEARMVAKEVQTAD